MKKDKKWWWAAISLTIAFGGCDGCGDSPLPTNDFCLRTGDASCAESFPYPECSSDPDDIVGNSCTFLRGECRLYGEIECAPGDQVAVCANAQPGAEICDNGKDDDCDGSVDEPDCNNGTGGTGGGGNTTSTGGQGTGATGTGGDGGSGATGGAGGQGASSTSGGHGGMGGSGASGNTTSTGGSTSSGGNPSSSGGGGSGGGYNCTMDDLLGQPCISGVGICQANGVWQCNQAFDGLICSQGPGQPNPNGEICNNGLDDDCDAATDEPSCNNGGGTSGNGGSGNTTTSSTTTTTTTGNGGSTGNGGTGGGGNGNGGGEPCTPVAPFNVTTVGSTGLLSLQEGESSISTSNPRVQSMNLGNVRALIPSNGLSVSTQNNGVVNIFETTPQSLEVIDIEYIAYQGNPPGTIVTNADRHSATYLRVFIDAFNCWRVGQCQAYLTFDGMSVPDTLFLLTGSVNGAPFTTNYSGEIYFAVEVPGEICD